MWKHLQREDLLAVKNKLNIDLEEIQSQWESSVAYDHETFVIEKQAVVTGINIIERLEMGHLLSEKSFSEPVDFTLFLGPSIYLNPEYIYQYVLFFDRVSFVLPFLEYRDLGIAEWPFENDRQINSNVWAPRNDTSLKKIIHWCDHGWCDIIDPDDANLKLFCRNLFNKIHRPKIESFNSEKRTEYINSDDFEESIRQLECFATAQFYGTFCDVDYGSVLLIDNDSRLQKFEDEEFMILVTVNNVLYKLFKETIYKYSTTDALSYLKKINIKKLHDRMVDYIRFFPYPLADNSVLSIEKSLFNEFYTIFNTLIVSRHQDSRLKKTTNSIPRLKRTDEDENFTNW